MVTMRRSRDFHGRSRSGGPRSDVGNAARAAGGGSRGFAPPITASVARWIESRTGYDVVRFRIAVKNAKSCSPCRNQKEPWSSDLTGGLRERVKMPAEPTSPSTRETAATGRGFVAVRGSGDAGMQE